MNLSVINDTTLQKLSSDELFKLEQKKFKKWANGKAGRLTHNELVELFAARYNKITKEISLIYTDAHNMWLSTALDLKRKGASVRDLEMVGDDVIKTMQESLKGFIDSTQQIAEEVAIKNMRGNLLDKGKIPPVKFIHMGLSALKGEEWADKLFKDTLNKLDEFISLSNKHLSYTLTNDTFTILNSSGELGQG